MTDLLEKAIAAIRDLPPERQDAIGALILEELVEDAKWQRSFAQSQDRLAKLADEALADFKSGRTSPLEFPRRK